MIDRSSQTHDLLRRLRAPSDDVDHFVKLIHELLSVMKIGMGSVIEPGQRLYRATKYHRTIPTQVSEIAAPPANRITSLGRCNRVGQSLFYCSSDQNCVLEEISPSVNDLVVRATWQTTERMFLQDIGYSNEAFARAGATRSLPDKYVEFSARLDDNARLIRDHIAAAFVDRTSKNYALTAAIAEVHLRSEHDIIAGVMYPSITRSGNCDNLALRPGFVARGMRLTAAEAVRVRAWNKTSPDAYGIADLAAVDANGALVWSYSGAENTPVPKDRPGAMLIKPGEILTIGGDDNTEIALNGEYYVVSPGYTVRLEDDKITVRDPTGALVDPLPSSGAGSENSDLNLSGNSGRSEPVPPSTRLTTG